MLIIILHPEQTTEQFLQIVALIEIFRQQNQDITRLMHMLTDHHLRHPAMDDEIISNLSKTMLTFVSSFAGQKAQDDPTPEQIFQYETFLRLLDYNRVPVFDQVKIVSEKQRNNQTDNLL